MTALGLSAPMVDVARAKLLSENLKANLLVANMTDFKIDRKFSLAIIARSGFMHLLTAKEQRQALLNIKNHLTDGGLLTFNHFQPYPIIQAKQMQSSPDDYSYRAEYLNSEGKKERISEALTYDYISQVMRGNWKFETLDDDGNVIAERIRPQAMRHTYRQEMEYLSAVHGILSRIFKQVLHQRFDKFSVARYVHRMYVRTRRDMLVVQLGFTGRLYVQDDIGNV